MSLLLSQLISWTVFLPCKQVQSLIYCPWPSIKTCENNCSYNTMNYICFAPSTTPLKNFCFLLLDSAIICLLFPLSLPPCLPQKFSQLSPHPNQHHTTLCLHKLHTHCFIPVKIMSEGIKKVKQILKLQLFIEPHS